MDHTFNELPEQVFICFTSFPRTGKHARSVSSHMFLQRIFHVSPCAFLLDFPVVLMPTKVDPITEQVDQKEASWRHFTKPVGHFKKASLVVALSEMLFQPMRQLKSWFSLGYYSLKGKTQYFVVKLERCYLSH